MTDEINIDNISHLPQTNIPSKDIPDNILLNTRKELLQLDLEAKLEKERKRLLAGKAMGMQSTILTGGQGVEEEATTSRTLLGGY